MKLLYAPWRHAYVTKKNKPKESYKNNCVFCDKFAQDTDTQNLILKRLTHSIIMMNYYPYNAGHLMILPIEHAATLEQLSPAVRSELMEATTATNTILTHALSSQGMNIGINLGVAGGGGIPSHLHIHVLPRWQGDTSFMATLSDTKLICSDFHELYHELKPHFDLLKI